MVTSMPSNTPSDTQNHPNKHIKKITSNKLFMLLRNPFIASVLAALACFVVLPFVYFAAQKNHRNVNDMLISDKQQYSMLVFMLKTSKLPGLYAGMPPNEMIEHGLIPSEMMDDGNFITPWGEYFNIKVRDDSVEFMFDTSKKTCSIFASKIYPWMDAVFINEHNVHSEFLVGRYRKARRAINKLCNDPVKEFASISSFKSRGLNEHDLK